MTKVLPVPQLEELLTEMKSAPKLAQLLDVGPLPGGEYYHWEELRHRSPPEGMTVREWWAGVKLARIHLLKPITLLDQNGDPFKYGLPDPLLKLLHEIDQQAAGGIQMPEEVTNPATRDRYIINSLMEESITSSQLEGASTTADVAKNMIRSGRKPTDRSEQMILNNFYAMRFVQQNKNAELTPEFVFELHRIVTDQTIDDATKAGRFRDKTDEIVVEDGLGNLLHVPPPTEQLGKRLKAMCSFANSRPGNTFVHPVVRAIILHFWLGYDHPFVDGNGRTARALFYWSMLSQGYWLAEFLSISRILKKAPGKYSRSFVMTETDGNDLTYFLLYQVRVLRRSIDELQSYLKQKVKEIREVESLLRESDLNHRQLTVLSHALKHPGARYTIQSHQKSHNVVYQTARTDLLSLASRGLLSQHTSGNAYIFTAPQDLSNTLKNASGVKLRRQGR